jgi:hypothetical protein
MSDKYLDYAGLNFLMNSMKPEAIEDSFVKSLFDTSIVIEPVYDAEHTDEVAFSVMEDYYTGLLNLFVGYVYVTQNGATRAAELRCLMTDGVPTYTFKYGTLGSNHQHIESPYEEVSGAFSNLKVFNKNFGTGTCSVSMTVLGQHLQIDGASLSVPESGTK